MQWFAGRPLPRRPHLESLIGTHNGDADAECPRLDQSRHDVLDSNASSVCWI